MILSINKFKTLKTYGVILTIVMILSFLALLNQMNININDYGLFLAIIIPFIINFLFKEDDIKMYMFINIYILINILLILVTTFQANNLGYLNGIFKGNVDGVSYYDAAEYYENSIYVSDLNVLDFIKMIFNNLDSGNKFYNIFVLYNMIICKIFGNKITTLLLIKFNFTIASMHIINKIAKKVNIRNTLTPIIIFSLYPGMLQSNVSLLRDNIILFLLVSIIYNYLNLKSKKNLKISTLNLIISGIFLCIFRFYTLVICIISIIIISKSNNIKSLLKKVFIVMFFSILVCNISIKLGYGFFGIEYINNYMTQMSIFQAILQCIIRIAVGFRIIFETMYNGIIPNILLMTSPIYIFIINLILIFKIFSKLDKEILPYLNFYFIFAFLNGVLMVLRDGIIVDRIYIMWLWIPCLIMLNTNKLKYNGV